MQKLTTAYTLWHHYLPCWPRLSRHSLGAKIDNLFTDILEEILLAKYADRNNKLILINRAISKLDCLKFFLQIAWQLKIFDNKKYLELSGCIIEIGRMLGGWQRQAQK